MKKSTRNKIIFLLFFSLTTLTFLFVYPVVWEHGQVDPPEDLDFVNIKYSMIQLLSGWNFEGGIALLLSIIPPCLFILLSIYIRRPFKIQTIVLFILFGIANLLYPLYVILLLCFNFMGPKREMIDMGFIVLRIDFLSGILFCLAGIKASMFGKWFEEVK